MDANGVTIWWSYRCGADCPFWLLMRKIIHWYSTVVRGLWPLLRAINVWLNDNPRNLTGIVEANFSTVEMKKPKLS